LQKLALLFIFSIANDTAILFSIKYVTTIAILLLVSGMAYKHQRLKLRMTTNGYQNNYFGKMTGAVCQSLNQVVVQHG